MALSFFLTTLIFFIFILESSSIRLLINYSIFFWLISLNFYMNMESFKFLIPLWLILSTGLFVIFAYIISLEEKKKNKKIPFLKSLILSLSFFFLKEHSINEFYYKNYFVENMSKNEFYGFFEDNIYFLQSMWIWLMILIFLAILFLMMLGSKGRGLRNWG